MSSSSSAAFIACFLIHTQKVLNRINMFPSKSLNNNGLPLLKSEETIFAAVNLVEYFLELFYLVSFNCAYLTELSIESYFDRS
mmetsp:Transcript_5189/g.6881  ORF Transcript_5189/g.6881 Transcript_5189/m.6881 type:complete len:83 (+) Transcript_5189:795-1043(+)